MRYDVLHITHGVTMYGLKTAHRDARKNAYDIVYIDSEKRNTCKMYKIASWKREDAASL